MSGLEANSDVACWPGPYESERRPLVAKTKQLQHPGVLQPVGEADPGRSQTPKATSPELSTLRLGVQLRHNDDVPRLSVRSHEGKRLLSTRWNFPYAIKHPIVAPLLRTGAAAGAFARLGPPQCAEANSHLKLSPRHLP